MAKYIYVIEKDGKQLTESIDAKDKYAVFTHVRETGGKLISMTEEGQGWMQRANAMLEKVSTVSTYDVIIFARTLSAMLVAGLPLSRALSISTRQVSNAKFRSIIDTVAEKIKGGQPFNLALAEHSVFSPLFLAMVRAGEESGALPNSLALVADQLERGYKLKKQIKGAMMYPLIVVIAMFGVTYLMLTQIMPTMIQSFTEQNIKLPATTQALVTASDFLTQHTVLFFLCLTIGISAIVGLAKTQKGKWVIHRALIYMPVVGPMVIEVNAARGGRTLASLTASGVDMVRALTITKDVMVNTAFREVIEHAEQQVHVY
jgi:type II secretory pathway component PulF